MKKKLLLPFLMLIICFFLFNILSCQNKIENVRIKAKITKYTLLLDDEQIEFQTLDELKDKLKPIFESKNSLKEVIFTYQNKKDTYSIEELGATYNTSKICDRIFNDLKDGDKVTLLSKDLIPDIDETKLDEFIKEYSKSIYVKPIDCTFNFNSTNLSIKTHSKNGLSVSYDALRADLLNILNKRTESKEINVKVLEVEPNLSDNLIKNMTLYSKSTTNLIDKSKNRLNNINLFCSSLSGTVINPSQVFSVNEKTGERNFEKGYKKAKGFIDGKIVEFDGAGICQVVSTLYNSVLYTDLAVIERAPHEGPVPYISIGLDATIYHGLIDFKFKNTLKSPIILQCFSNGKNVTIKIFAQDFNPNRKFKIEVKKRDKFNSKTYKHIYEDNKYVKSILVSSDKYKKIKKN